MKRLALLLLLPAIAMAQPDKVIRLEGISIQGSSEEPQVMFIAPWKEAAGTARLYQEAASYRQQWLHSLDEQRLQHEMQLPQYYLRPTEQNADK